MKDIDGSMVRLRNDTVPSTIITVLSSSQQSLKMVSNTSTVVILLKCLLLIACPVVITAADDCAENLKDEKYISEYRLPPKIIPVHYDIWLNLFVTGPKFSGEINITLEIKPTKHDYQKYRDSHVLVLHFSDTVVRGQYTLYFKYNGYFSEEDEGLIKLPDESLRSENTKWMVISQFGKTAARRVFPCWDEPALKATFNISVKHHLHHSAISTMPIQKEDHISRNLQVWSHFEKTPKMSTHLLGIVVIAASRCDFDDIFHMWCRQYTFVPDDFKQTVRQQYRTILSHMTNHTNISMTIPKLDIIIVPDYVLNNATIWGMLLMNQFGSATSDDFWDAMQSALDDTEYQYNFKIKEVMHNWLNQTTYSLVKNQLHGIVDGLLKNIGYDDENHDDVITLLMRGTALKWACRFGDTLCLEKTRRKLDMRSSDDWAVLIGKRLYSKTTLLTDIILNVYSEEQLNKVSNTSTAVILLKCLLLITYPICITAADYCVANLKDGKYISEYRLPPDIIPVHYDISLNLFITGPKFSGKIDITLEINCRTQYITLHAHRLEIDKWQTKLFYHKNGTIYTPAEHRYRNQQVLDLSFNTTLEHGNYTLRFMYDGYFSHGDEGLIKIPDTSLKSEYTNQFGSATPDDFWDAMQSALEDTEYQYNFKIKEVMHNWLNQTTYSLVKSHMLEILRGLLKNIGYDDENHDDGITLLMRGTALKWACRLGDYVCKEKARTKLEMRSNDDWAVFNGKRVRLLNGTVPSTIDNTMCCLVLTRLSRCQFGLATPDDFWDAMQSALDNAEYKHNFEVKEVMRNWLNVTTYSLVKVKRNCKNDQVVISRHDTKKADNRIWTPVTFATHLYPNFDDYFAMPTHWLRKDYIHWQRNDTAVVVPVAPSDWIIVNLQYGDNQHSHIFGILIRKYAQKNEVLDHILPNLENVKPRSYSRIAVLKEIISNLYSEEQLNKTQNFFKQDAEMSETLTTMIPMRLIQLQDMKISFLERFS
ncbi:hypothetical protein DMN91_005145 [Ooceraea biroi]|uniref:Aminopeptidase N-like N-terminal domain-containing protein n=1 Tax=Ooceraea biroi TaxID=2015173 RepID=A0A3L8DR33_OOCBI|nr:hypothetical protein DMN91_005145 [Ooceraea biroi]